MTSLRGAALAMALALSIALPSAARAQGDEFQEAHRLFKQGQLDRAMDRVDAFLAGRPKDARGRFLKGLILAEQTKTAEAINVFTALTQDFPELPEPYNNLAVLYASQGQYDKARTALEMAIRTHPSYATAHENLGDIYAKMASQAYDKALQLDRGNTAAQTKLNLIRDLFSGASQAGRPAASARAEPPPRVASSAPATKTEPAAKTGAPAAALSEAPAPKPPAAAPSAKASASQGASGASLLPEPNAASVATNRDENVLRVVTAWANAWSANDVAGYLARYAPDFETPKGMSRADWEAQRKVRIAKPRQISVEIESPTVRFDGSNRATVTFRQHYRSDNFKSSTRKTLVMIRSGETWLIQQEDVGG